MTASLTSLTDLGTVTKEHHNLDTGLFQMPMPGSPASSSIQLDIFGASHSVTITGVYVFGSGTNTAYANRAAVKAAFIAVFNGAQSSKTLVLSDGDSYTGLIASINYDEEAGDVNELHYEINFVEGTVA